MLNLFIDLEGVLTNKGDMVGKIMTPLLKDKYSKKEVRAIYKKAKISNDYSKSFFNEELIQGILERTKLHENAKEFLEKLDKLDSNLFLASNHMSLIAKRKLKHWKFEHYFNKIFISSDLGISKPHKEFFEKILELSNAKGKNIFIDDAKTNLRNAKKAGFTTIWVNNNDNDIRNEIDYEADYKVNNLLEIIDILNKLN